MLVSKGETFECQAADIADPPTSGHQFIGARRACMVKRGGIGNFGGGSLELPMP